MPTGWRLTEDDKAALVDDYQGGFALSVIAAKYGCTTGNVRALLRRRGVPTRRPGGQTLGLTPEQERFMVDAYKAGQSQEQVAKAMGIGQVTVGRHLRRLGVEMRYAARSGALNGNWKGGRIVQGGYVYLLLPDDDPMASMRNKEGYVAEHRLVMARHLGRPLTRRETVHHLNDNGTDNAIGNLQLRQGQHGTGAAWVCQACGSTDVAATALGAPSACLSKSTATMGPVAATLD